MGDRWPAGRNYFDNFSSDALMPDEPELTVPSISHTPQPQPQTSVYSSAHQSTQLHPLGDPYRGDPRLLSQRTQLPLPPEFRQSQCIEHIDMTSSRSFSNSFIQTRLPSTPNTNGYPTNTPAVATASASFSSTLHSFRNAYSPTITLATDASPTYGFHHRTYPHPHSPQYSLQPRPSIRPESTSYAIPRTFMPLPSLPYPRSNFTLTSVTPRPHHFRVDRSWQLRATNVPRKSRIETQVKLVLELHDVSASANAAPGAGPDTLLSVDSGEPVTNYSFVRVPKTASVKTKSRGVCDPDPSKVLNLTASIYCAKDDQNQIPVPCCVDCQRRERKRNIKKAAATSSTKTSRSVSTSKNATPATSDVEAYAQPWGQGTAPKEDADVDSYVSPIDFTCAPMLDFSSGSTPLSFRIVCYCRHHKEKTGFCVTLTLKDTFGRTIGEVTTHPIMITDDHKSVPKLTPAHTADEEDGDSYGVSTKRRAKRMLAKYSEGENRMKQEDGDDGDEAGVGAIRTKHRLNRKSNTLSRSANGISKLTSTSAASNLGGPPITTTTNIYNHGNHAEPSGTGHGSSHSYATHSESPLATTAPSSPSAGFSPPPVTGGVGGGDNTNNYMGDMDGVMNSFASLPLLSPASATFQSPIEGSLSMHGLMSTHMSGLTAATQTPLPPSPNPYPLITKVIPASGPMLGGIEVTLLGANFSRELLANAVIAFGSNYVTFAGSGTGVTMIDGGSVGTGAQVWSETVIICTLPPSVVPGPVEVKLLGVPMPANQMDMDQIQTPPTPIFMYTDENERDLMITALQTLGWQNSGQWQDARSVAMHILGSQNRGMGGMMGMDDMSNTDLSSILGGPYNFSTAASGRSSAPGPSTRPSQSSRKVEEVVLRVLRSAQHPVTGVISQISTPHPVTGQTLLHLAAALGLSKLVLTLIGWKANVLIPDKNGFSPVHFACFYGRTECAEILVRIGRAHLEGRDVRGRTPLDICGTDEVRELVSELEEEVETRKLKSRIGSEVESGGEGDDEGLSWSEADEEEEDQQPTIVSGAKAPQSVSRRISRVNSMVSIASHKGISRTATPYQVDDILTPITTMHHPTPSKAMVPPSSSSSWALGRNISVPWPTGGWQFPNVPAMPQFGQRRGAGPKHNHREDNSQEEKEQMFKWMMWMDTARNMWQAQQQQQITEADIDPPPMYSPTGAVSMSVPPHEKGVTSAAGTTAVPTALDEPPSPLSLDSPCSTGKVIAGQSELQGRSRQRQLSCPRHAEDPFNTILSLSTSPSTKTVVKRKTKTRDTMLIYFWIPVLLLVITWATYRSLMGLHRLLLPNTQVTVPVRVAVEL